MKTKNLLTFAGALSLCLSVSEAATQVVLTENATNALLLEGTSSEGNAIAVATTDPAGWANFDYAINDNTDYTDLFGTGPISNPHSATNGGAATITITNDNAFTEFTYLLIYDIDFGTDMIQFTSGDPVFYGTIGNLDTSQTPSNPIWDPVNQTLTGENIASNTNVAIFDITGINSVVFNDLTSIPGRSFNVGIYTSATPIPEPSSSALLGLGGLALLARRRRA